MERDFEITIGRDGLPTQTFNGLIFRLYPKERYFSRGTKRMHVYVWEYYNGKKPKGYHIHHKDEDASNNRPENLECVEAYEHLSEHIKVRIKENKEWFKEFHTKGIESAKEWHKSEEGRQWHSEHGKRMWINREYKDYNCQQCGKEFKSRHSGVVKYCHNNCKAQALRDRRKLERGSI